MTVATKTTRIKILNNVQNSQAGIPRMSLSSGGGVGAGVGGGVGCRTGSPWYQYVPPGPSFFLPPGPSLFMFICTGTEKKKFFVFLWVNCFPFFVRIHMVVFRSMHIFPRSIPCVTWQCFPQVLEMPLVERIPVLDDIGVEYGFDLAPTEGFLLLLAVFGLWMRLRSTLLGSFDRRRNRR